MCMTEQAALKKAKYDPDKDRVLWEKYEQRKAELDQQGLSPADYFDACQRIAQELGI